MFLSPSVCVCHLKSVSIVLQLAARLVSLPDSLNMDLATAPVPPPMSTMRTSGFKSNGNNYLYQRQTIPETENSVIVIYIMYYNTCG